MSILDLLLVLAACFFAAYWPTVERRVARKRPQESVEEMS